MRSVDIDQILLLAGIITALLGGIMVVLVFFIMRNRSTSTYNFDQHHAVLSDMRASYESQLLRLSQQLQATQERWIDANHLIISSQNAQPDAPSAGLDQSSFLKSLGVDLSSIKPDRKLVLFLTPFSDEEKRTYSVVRDLCHANGFRCVRGDEEYAETGDILRHVVTLIAQSRIVIANISSRNPNVFYELGIAHSLAKQTILISRTLDGTPFDVAAKRIVLFDDYADLEDKLTRALLQTLSVD